MQYFDIAIIGAGPVGLFSIFQAGMLGLSACVFDSLEMIGGQCSALYPEKPIYDIPAYSKISGQELIDNLYAQALPFKPVFFLGQHVLELKKSEGLFCIKTSSSTNVLVKAVIIAAGSGSFGHNRPLIDNIEAFEGKSVFYVVKDPQSFANKNIAIAGGGDSALDWAIVLSEIANKIFLIHRRNKFRALPASVNKMEELVQNGKVELVIPYQLHSLRGTNGNLEGVLVATLDDVVRTLPADVLLSFFGLSAKLGPILEWGLDLEQSRILVDPATMETSVKGIFAVGDIVHYPGKLKLILTGFAEAAVACHSAYRALHPEKEIHFEHSTTKGLPA